MKLILTVFILIFQIYFLSAEQDFNFIYYDIPNQETFMLCTDVAPEQYTSTLVISTISDSKLIEVIDIKETGHEGSCFNFEYSKFKDLIGSQKSRYVLILESNSESNKDENRKENYVEFTIQDFTPQDSLAISYQIDDRKLLKLISTNNLTQAFLTEENVYQECTVNSENSLCHTNEFTSDGTSIKFCGNQENGLMRCQTDNPTDITTSECNKDVNLISELEFNIDMNTVKTISNSPIDIIFQDDFLCFGADNSECEVPTEHEPSLNFYGTDRTGACELISAYVSPMHFLDVEIALEVSWLKHPGISRYDLGVTETNSPARKEETHTKIDCTLIPEGENCEGYIFETPKAYKFDLKELGGKTKLVQEYEPKKEQEIRDEITTKTPEYMIHTSEGQLEVCYSDDTGKKGTLTVTDTTANSQINVPSESSTLTQCVKFDFKNGIKWEVISRYNILFAGNEFSHKEYSYESIIQIEKLETIEEYNILKLNLNKVLPSTNILYIEDEKIHKTECGLPDSKEANRCYQTPLDITAYKAMCATENVDGTLICKEQEPTEPEKMDPQEDILNKSNLLMAEPYTITTQFEQTKNVDLLILTTTNEKPEEYINIICTENFNLSSNPLDYDTIKIMAITNTNEGKNYYHVEKFYHTEMNSLYVQGSVIETNWLLQKYTEIETDKMYTISLDGKESRIDCTAIDYNSICYGFHFGVEPENKPSEITLTPAENKITSISLTAE